MSALPQLFSQSVSPVISNTIESAEILIRPMKPDDFGPMMCRLIGASPEGLMKCKNFYLGFQRDISVATKEGNIVGVAWTKQDNRLMLVVQSAEDDEIRNKFVKTAAERCIESGRNQLHVVAGADDAKMHALLTRHGAVKTGTSDLYRIDGLAEKFAATPRAHLELVVN